MKVISNISYGKDSESQKLDVYLPDNSAGKIFPLIFFIHGGAFSSGDKAMGKVLDLVRFNTQNYVIASVNYRLSGEAGFPTGIKDCENALRFLVENAKKYQIDPTKVALMGSSSGGNYALMLGLNQRLLQNFERVCIAVLYPVTDLLALSNFVDFLADDSEVKDYMIKNSEMYFKKNFKDITASDLKKASPLYMLKTTLPPTLLQHGTADDTAPISQSQSFYDKAKGIGADITFEVFEGAKHSDKMFATKNNLKHIFDFVDSKLN